MPRQADADGWRSRPRWLIALAVVAALIMGLAGYCAARTLRRDDCTAVMSRMPDGSQIRITTCS